MSQLLNLLDRFYNYFFFSLIFVYFVFWLPFLDDFLYLLTSLQNCL